MLTCVCVQLPPVIEGAVSFQDAFNLDLDENRGVLGSWFLRNIRQVIPSSALAFSGSLVRIYLETTIPAAGYIHGFSIDGCYIGHQALSGDAYDFDGGQVQVTFEGGNPGVIAPQSTIIRSDTIAFNLDNTKNLIIAMHFDASSSTRATVNGVTDFDAYIGPQDVDETATTSVTGYSLDDDLCLGVQRIDVAG